MAWSVYSSLKGRPKPDKEACTQSFAIYSHECLPVMERDAQWLFLSSESLTSKPEDDWSILPLHQDKQKAR